MQKFISLGLLLTTSLGLVLFAQSPAPQNGQKLVVSTSEVQLDVVVKDKKGRIVKDLRPGDFEVYEDGVKQNIESFRLVTREATANTSEVKSEVKTAVPRPSTPNTPAPRPKTEENAGVIAIVFDRLSPDARKRARDAAMTYVGENVKLDDYVGVFVVNLGIATLQNYTTNAQLVRAGIDNASLRAASNFETANNANRLNEQATQARAASASAAAGAGAAGAAGGAGAGAAGSAAGAADVDARFAEMQARTEETFTVLQRDQQGYATTNGLLAVVNSMKSLPGRKAIIFFSEGMAIPPNVRQHFRSVVNNANRANVSVYAVDAAGLRPISPTQESRDEINARTRQRMDNLDRVFTGGAMTMGLERNEDLLKLNPQSSLMDLAQETGGAFIGDTNNMGQRLKQVDEDMHSYYLLSYEPTNQNYDGKFRNVSVKLNRSGVDVQSRQGYYAVTPTGSSPVLFYEAPALAILNSATPPNDFLLQSLSLHFPENERPGLTTISVQVPATAFTFTENRENKDKPLFNADFSIVVLVKDQAKQVIDKLSYHYSLVGPLDQAAKTKEQKVLFYRELNLPPGNYLIEAIAHDTVTNKASVRKRMLEIPDVDETALRLSNVTIIQRVEQLKPEEKTNSPLQTGTLMIYPSFGEPISKAAGKMGFFFNVYPAKGTSNKPNLTLEIVQNGKAIANVPMQLSSADATGKIAQVSTLPLDSLNPGLYQLKITAKDNQRSVSRSTYFTVAP
jgi:VWFA-related protein